MQQQINHVERSNAERFVQDGVPDVRFEIQPIAVAQEEQHHVVMLLADRRAKGADDRRFAWPLVGQCLDGPAGLNPAFDVVDVAG